MIFKIITVYVCLLWCFIANAQDIHGKWKTINRHTGEVRSIIEVFEKDQKIYGRVIQIMDPEDQDNICTKCAGDDKNQKIEGLVLMKDFRKEGQEYVEGTITNPDDGKIYESKLWLDEEDPNILHVRGYIGIFYKTMEWQRFTDL